VTAPASSRNYSHNRTGVAHINLAMPAKLKDRKRAPRRPRQRHEGGGILVLIAPTELPLKKFLTRCFRRDLKTSAGGIQGPEKGSGSGKKTAQPLMSSARCERVHGGFGKKTE